jgi:hypothetical protein
LAAFEDDQSDRVAFCHREGEESAHEGAGAEGRWRKLNGHHLVALVRAGAKFENGELVEGSEAESEEKVAA